MSLNIVTLQGRLTKDPTFTKDASDETKDRTRFQLAVNRINSDVADFPPVVCWGKLARAVAQYCSKGRQVTVEGALRTQMYENVLRSEVKAKTITFGPEAKKAQTVDKKNFSQKTTGSKNLENLNELIAEIVKKTIAEKISPSQEESENYEPSEQLCPL